MIKSKNKCVAAFAATAVLALGLYGCGGGGGSTTAIVPDPMPDPMPDPDPDPMPEIVDLTNVSPGLMAAAGTVQLAAGQSIVRGGIEFTCAAGGDDCTVTIANDGTATSTGGTVNAMNAMASEFEEERLTASPLASPEASSAADTLASFVDSDVSFGPVVAPVKYETDEFGDRGLVPLEAGDGAAYVESGYGPGFAGAFFHRLRRRRREDGSRIRARARGR